MTKTRKISLFLPKNLFDEILKEAGESERTVSAQIRYIIKDWFLRETAKKAVTS